MQRNILSKNLLKSLSGNKNIVIPEKEVFRLPEMVLQFGTGVLLRGLPDFYIDESNRVGKFQGRVVVVKSTEQGELTAYEKQDCLYTICMRGKSGNHIVDKTIVNASISRVLRANKDWPDVLDFACSTSLKIVISNTTEAGIVYVEEDIFSGVPASYPGKLLRILFQRYSFYKGDPSKGLVILPTELIEYNGDKLRFILKKLINYNQLDKAFEDWFNQNNFICNTLVDRIVPGKLAGNDLMEKERILGYTDELMISCEPFGLWVIESTLERVINTVSFVNDHGGCTIVSSINKYKELKLRMLNATHTFSCALSLLAGKKTVKQSMDNNDIYWFINKLLFIEIQEAIIGDEILGSEAQLYGQSVLDRFANPFLQHKWENISVQYPLKIKERCIPLIIAYWIKKKVLPKYMLLGLAAYFIWSDFDLDRLVDDFSVTSKWDKQLSDLPGFSSSIHKLTDDIKKNGLLKTLKAVHDSE